MKKSRLFAFIFLFHEFAYSQICPCEKQFQFVLSYIEQNNPAYQTWVINPIHKIQYDVKKNLLLEKSRLSDSIPLCYSILQEYLSEIKDHHTQIFYNKFSKTNPPSNINNIPFEFQNISDSVNYLKVSSFNSQIVSKLNKFYDSLQLEIYRRPYLIIDLRNNGGGSDEGWLKLLPVIYTKPFELDEVRIWVSESNILYYQKNYPQDKALLKKLQKQRKPSFYTWSKSHRENFGVTKRAILPRKVILFQNRKSASSAEDFILLAKQSKKVITMGIPTGGFTGYGNVMAISTPDNIFTLQSTTTRYMNGSKYEYIGIPPQINLDESKDWIKEAIKYF